MATLDAFWYRRARHLGRVDHAGLDQVFVDAGGGVVAVGALRLGDLLADDAAVLAGVVGDLRQRCAGSARITIL